MVRLYLILVIGLIGGSGDTSVHRDRGRIPTASIMPGSVPTDTVRVGMIFRGEGDWLFRVTRRIRLSEERMVMSDIASVAFPNDSHFVVLASRISGIVLYDTTGRQVRTMSRRGTGPLEYDRPSLARASDDSVVVWDGGNKKFLFFDGDGESLDEITGFTWKTLDFVFRGDRILGYRAGNRTEELLYEFDGGMEKLRLSGKSDAQHAALSVLPGGGQLLAGIPGKYVYATSGNPQLHLVEDGEATRTVRIPAPYFQRSEIKPGFLERNHRVNGIWNLDGMIVALLEEGLPSLTGPVRQRFVHLVIFSRDLEYLDTVRMPESVFEATAQRFVGSHGRSLYMVGNPRPADRDRSRFLIELSLEEVSTR